MKYLIACLLIPSVQIMFLFAFTLFALGMGVSVLAERFRPKRIPARVYRQRR